MAVKRDYYDVLGVPRDADDAEIKRAFRRLAQRHHPDVDTGDGAGFYNGDRKRQAAALVAFADQVSADKDIDPVFFTGDFNSYSAEDPVQVPSLIRDALGISGSEARRMLRQGAVRLNGDVTDAQETSRDQLVGRVLQVGKRRFVRLLD